MSESVHEALEREHHEIDAAIDAFMANIDDTAAAGPPLRAAIAALRRHIYIEEAMLFPPLRPDAMMPVIVMCREHGDIWRTMDRIEALLDAGADPQELDGQCVQLLALLAEHNAKEEPIIYPMADSALSVAECDDITRFIATGSTPDGWVCEQAAR